MAQSLSGTLTRSQPIPRVFCAGCEVLARLPRTPYLAGFRFADDPGVTGGKRVYQEGSSGEEVFGVPPESVQAFEERPELFVIAVRHE